MPDHNRTPIYKRTGAKAKYTLQVLELLEKNHPSQVPQFSTMDALVRHWFVTGPATAGLRLSPDGAVAFDLAGMERYTCYLGEILGNWYQFLINTGKNIKCPYYLSQAIMSRRPEIVVYDSQIAMLIELHGSLKEYLESFAYRMD